MKSKGLNLEEIVARLETIAPLDYAEEWDNVGLLLGALERRVIERVLLTIDLSESVVDEALQKRIDLIVSYHPAIFTPLTRLNGGDPRHRSLMRLISDSIAVYSPHTALDAVPGGINDWLAAMIGPGRIETISPLSPGNPDVGMGRLAKLEEQTALRSVLKRVSEGLDVERPRIALAEGGADPIRTVAVCAGAGDSVLKGVEADLYISGEMKHHSVLAANQSGIHVALFEHSNTERGYLPVLAGKIRESLESPPEVLVSECDRDPFDQSG